ncbi:PIG-L family deacetylase [Polynucleobacter sp. AP-Jannik-300A-C4]|uniref:PIG-L deacetylase family protein n=1 Tax=Polynucleobacter sp. AP-Jannik-300A-C4 TaxID=2576928 RepID=UPI001BFD85A4|nr:PIG-L family deacetylase [Polynucleobacter sp. AP-Jannik-300A-C4]QWE22936.1 PIG-L family deacetylase [Polynucleobacter sp. AP-Jannik-300A-C4]
MKSINENILVIVAHTDDEAIGLGGTLARHAKEGANIFGLSMTNGVDARVGSAAEDAKERRAAAQRAAKLIGLSWVDVDNFPDNRMDSVPILDVVRVIEKIKYSIKPVIIYTHSCADLNVDHRVVSQATLTAFRPQPGESWQEIRTFEIPSATDFGCRSVTNLFCPNLYINIEDTWATKAAALKEYQAEMRFAPHSRSLEGIENLAKLRGNQVGMRYAEAFEVIRKIVR